MDALSSKSAASACPRPRSARDTRSARRRQHRAGSGRAPDDAHDAVVAQDTAQVVFAPHARRSERGHYVRAAQQHAAHGLLGDRRLGHRAARGPAAARALSPGLAAGGGRGACSRAHRKELPQPALHPLQDPEAALVAGLRGLPPGGTAGSGSGPQPAG